MKNYRLALACIVLVAIAGCTTRNETNPPRSATEEMIISTAADRAADKLFVGVKPGTKAFVDASNFEGTDSKYAIGSIRASLLKRGVALVADRKTAQIVVEARAGALSTDQNSLLIGIPAFNIPVPLASGTLPFPEIALYKDTEQKGVAKFAVIAYTATDGNMVAVQDPQYGFSHRAEKTIAIFFSYTESDAIPPEYNSTWQDTEAGVKAQFSAPQPESSDTSAAK